MRARISVGLLFACLSIGCGSSAPLVPDAGGDGAPSNISDASDAVVQEPDAIGAGFCTPGADQTCNDDPTISAFEGTCVPQGWCVCHDGFSINRKTNRCRVGTYCVAAASDEWQFRMPIDAGDCASRPPTACRKETLDTYDLEAMMMSATCFIPADFAIRIELAGGCPTLLEASSRSGRTTLSDSETKFLSCFAPLIATKRFSCPDSTCVMEEKILLY